MNKIRQIQELNKKEIEQGIPPQASWHTDYRDTAFVYFGGLPFELSEGDVITIFSQYGEPVFLKLARDQETGKSKGFGWLKYEDQRSTDLAVDNLGGASISGRLIHVDHARYKGRDDEDPDEFKVGWTDIQRREGVHDETDGSEPDTESDNGRRRHTHRIERIERKDRKERPMLEEERELQRLIEDHDDEDPMKEFLIEEKKKEVEAARQRAEDGEGESKSRHRHRSHRSHRSRRDETEADRERSPRKQTRHGDRPDDRDRRRDRDDRHRDRDVRDNEQGARRERVRDADRRKETSEHREHRSRRA